MKSGGWTPLAYPSSAVFRPPQSSSVSNDNGAFRANPFFPLHGDVLLAAVREMLVLDGALDRRTLDVRRVPERPPPLSSPSADEKNGNGKIGAGVSERRRRRRGGGGRNERRDRGDARSPPRGDGGGCSRSAPDGMVTPPIVADDGDGDEKIFEEPEPPGKDMSSSARKRRKMADGVGEAVGAADEPSRSSADAASVDETEERLPPGDLDAASEEIAVPVPEFLAESILRRGISYVATDVDELRDELGLAVSTFTASVGGGGALRGGEEWRSVPARKARKVSDAEAGDARGSDGGDIAAAAGRPSPSREGMLPCTAAASLALLSSNGVPATPSIVGAVSEAAARAAASTSPNDVGEAADRPLSATEGRAAVAAEGTAAAVMPPVPTMLQASIGVESRSAAPPSKWSRE